MAFVLAMLGVCSAVQADPFADAVIAYTPGQGVGAPHNDPATALGAPDYAGSAVSLGMHGSIQLAFTNNTVFDGDGYDFMVVEYGSREAPEVYVSNDNGATYTSAGPGVILNSVPHKFTETVYDLSDTGLTCINAIKVVDLWGWHSPPYSGLDLDGVVALNSQNPPCQLCPPPPGAITVPVWIPADIECGNVSSDVRVFSSHDAAGNKVEYVCADQGVNLDEFHLWYVPVEGDRRRVGRCPWAEGDNGTKIIHSIFPNCIMSTFHRSEEPGREQGEPDVVDWKTYWFVVSTGRLILRHFVSEDGPGGDSYDYLLKQAIDIDPIHFNPDPESRLGPMVTIVYPPCDNDRDGDCDSRDFFLVARSVGQCQDEGRYNEPADADHDGCVSSDDVTELFPVIPVEIDIKPGSYPNSIKMRSAGVIPVAIVSSGAFDALTIKLDTISLSGASVRIVGRSEKSLCHEEDVNGDGLMDVICQVLTAEFMLEEGESVAILEAETLDGKPIRGEDSVKIVPDT
jgi:hypothetical protein